MHSGTICVYNNTCDDVCIASMCYLHMRVQGVSEGSELHYIHV